MGEPYPLSKSQYTLGLACPRKLWLHRNRRELMAPVSSVEEAVFTQGHEVGRLAHALFPGGVLIEQDQTDPEGALASTAAAIAAGAVAIFEGAFRFEDVLIRADILARNADGRWDLLEVKSSLRAKADYYPDIAIQAYVLRNLGLALDRTFLLHLNGDYVRPAGAPPGALDPRSYFVFRPLARELEAHAAAIPERLAVLRETLRSSDEPFARIGSVCKNPRPCAFKSHCWRHATGESIHFLGGISDAERFPLMERGIVFTRDIPPETDLTGTQRIEVAAARAGVPQLNREPLERHLGQLRYPLHFLDFETIGYAIPPYPGTRPFESLIFQYSLDIQREPGGPLEHRDFLFESAADPRPECARRLAADVGGEGSVIAYHATFERRCLEELAARAPEHAPALTGIRQRLWDLETPFQKRWYWEPAFRGRSSIKSVLPALVPELSYLELGIQKGDEAQLAYQEFLEAPEGSAGRAYLREELLKYCGLDSLAMVRILEVLLARLAG